MVFFRNIWPKMLNIYWAHCLTPLFWSPAQLSNWLLHWRWLRDILSSAHFCSRSHFLSLPWAKQCTYLSKLISLRHVTHPVCLSSQLELAHRTFSLAASQDLFDSGTPPLGCSLIIKNCLDVGIDINKEPAIYIYTTRQRAIGHRSTVFSFSPLFPYY